VHELAARWGLEIGERIDRGNNSVVVRCRRADGTPAILKLAPDAAQARAEVAVLRAWRATGRVPAVLEADPASCALLLEAIPGDATLAQRPGAATLEDVAALIAELHRGAPPQTVGGAVTLRERVEYVFAWAAGRSDEPGLAAGRERALRLCEDPAGPDVLLHGDLHPGNVLDGGPQRGLVAVDPRPCVGEGAFDVVDWVFWGAHEVPAWRDRAARLAATLGYDERRVWEWCVAFAPMLAAGRARRGAPTAEVDALRALS
jgi:streptomycin 6-kinase